ncbi:MAG: flagellar basal body P-ring protein FlgI [Planctomycetota bacterium]
MPAIRLISFVVLVAATMLGCTRTVQPDTPNERYPRLPLREVPESLQGIVYQQVDLRNTGALQVSGYGLVVNLEGTGDSTAPIAVREYIEKEIIRRGFGSRNGPYAGVSPARILSDRRVAIVRVDGFIPPGAQKGQRFDIQVSALPGNQTTSLVGGTLYQSTLRQAERVTQFNPGEQVNVLASAQGDIFVNPEYAAEGADDTRNSRKTAALRTGVILNGGIVQQPRALVLQVRQPSRRTARFIEQRIDRHFQDTSIASAQDEGRVFLNVPEKYSDDWAHFAGIVLHLFPTTNETFAAAKALELAEAAEQPNAPLANISYAWEALGPAAIPAMQPLLNGDNADVQYAAARAAAFLGDRYSQQVLLRMGADSSHPYQLPAVETLGKLPETPETKLLLKELLDAESALVRIAAYEALAKYDDPIIFRQNIEGKFLLDIVQTDGPPVIYATRRGEPRIAVLGRPSKLRSPVIFGSLGNTFTISTDGADASRVRMFQRSGPGGRPVSVSSSIDMPIIVARLGGKSVPGEPRFEFDYGQVVALVNDMADKGDIVDTAGRQVAFRLQELPGLESLIQNAESIPSARDEGVEIPEIPDGRALRPTDNELGQPMPEVGPAPELSVDVVPVEQLPVEDIDPQELPPEFQLGGTK